MIKWWKRARAPDLPCHAIIRPWPLSGSHSVVFKPLPLWSNNLPHWQWGDCEVMRRFCIAMFMQDQSLHIPVTPNGISNRGLPNHYRFALVNPILKAQYMNCLIIWLSLLHVTQLYQCADIIYSFFSWWAFGFFAVGAMTRSVSMNSVVYLGS